MDWVTIGDALEDTVVKSSVPIRTARVRIAVENCIVIQSESAGGNFKSVGILLKVTNLNSHMLYSLSGSMGETRSLKKQDTKSLLYLNIMIPSRI